MNYAGLDSVVGYRKPRQPTQFVGASLLHERPTANLVAFAVAVC